MSGLIVVFAAIAALFLATAEYARKETIRGWLVSRDGVARITHNVAGIVDSIATKPGESVRAGDPVIYLSRDTFLEDGRSSSDEMLLELRQQVAALDRQAALVRAQAAIERDAVATQLQGLEQERGALSRQMIEQQRRLTSAREKLTLLKSAARNGAATQWEVLRQEDERIVLKQAFGAMQQSEMALEREREELMARDRSLPVETERLISSLMSQRSQLLQEITEQESTRRVVLKSPISGRLASLEIHEGNAVLPNQLLATVLPENMTMVAEVFVPSSAIGFIRPGQRARLMYDAFPLQQFGTFAGKVQSVSEFILMPSEVPQTFLLREATFKVHIAIDSDFVVLKSGNAPLRPGMLLAAEIILESRSLLDWLLEPLRLRQRDAA
ncbi:MAG: HlyD family efflux transporter periplasmic adaptor subunit [Gammaproteobacteria bacterium]|nr:HlyD family efflux transporter periplasmic adaptor subunit [Gammaproteobacteria bacterium]